MIIKEDQLDKLFFTSDTHFYHKNIIEYTNRPFRDVAHMNEELIKNWNNVVDNDSIIFHLGDFAFTANIKIIQDLIKSLNGKIYLIYGNHDYQNRLNRNVISDLFEGTFDILQIEVEDPEVTSKYQEIILCHYPLLTWNKKERGSWNLHGHIHSGPESIASERGLNISPAQLDVGVDNFDMTPVSYHNVLKTITKQYLGRL